MANAPDALSTPRLVAIQEADALEALVDASMAAWEPGATAYPCPETAGASRLVLEILAARYVKAGWNTTVQWGADGSGLLVLMDPQAKERAAAFVAELAK